MSRISVDFSHLAGSAAFDVLSYKDFHSRPPVVGRNKLEGFGNSGVSSGFVRPVCALGLEMSKTTPCSHISKP